MRSIVFGDILITIKAVDFNTKSLNIMIIILNIYCRELGNMPGA